MEHRPIEAPEGGYVTSGDCRSCHPSNYASWHTSYHRTMTQVAKPTKIIPKLDGLELSIDGWSYRIDRKDDAYFMRKRPVNTRAEAYDQPREIVLLTGSHNLQNLWIATGQGRTLEHFPFAWLISEKMWAPVGDTFLSPPEFHALYSVGDWNDNCIDCHTTEGRARLVKGSTYDSKVSEFGISCEACHSEGRTHIDLNRNPVRRYLAHLTGRADPTIANPERMKSAESSLACGQCHSVWAFNSVQAKIDWTREGAKFRPGQSDLPERFVVQAQTNDHAEEKKHIHETNPHFLEDRFWGDGMVRVTGREFNGVQDSPCYKGGAFSCLTCHEMHPKSTGQSTLEPWKVNQLKPGAESDASCIQCHDKIGSNLSAHTHHAPESAGSRCYDCHMPHTTFGLLRALRSHQVSSPNVNESIKYNRPNACNLCHLDRPLSWTAERLQAWYKQPIPQLSRDDQEVATGVKWLLQGDAGERALIAWSMGWAPAQRAAGRDWIPPYLAATLNDPYGAVRFVAWKSLQSLPEFQSFPYNYTADPSDTKAASGRAYAQWMEQLKGQTHSFSPATLLDSSGRLNQRTYLRLLGGRDDRPIFLVE